MRKENEYKSLSTGEHIYLFLMGFGQALAFLGFCGALFFMGMLFGSLNIPNEVK